MDRLASKQLFSSKVHQLLGFAPSDAPWSFDLAVDGMGHACSDAMEYQYRSPWPPSPSRPRPPSPSPRITLALALALAHLTLG